jgi:tetratricopeptide (TPR) repeat protein
VKSIASGVKRVASMFMLGGSNDDMRRRGDAYRDKREWALAEECYSKYLKNNPEDFDIYVQYGHALKELGRYDESGRAYGLAIRLRPDDYDVYLSLGHLYKLMGRKDDALSAYEHSAQLQGNGNEAIQEILAIESGISRDDLLARMGRVKPQHELKFRRIVDDPVFPIQPLDDRVAALTEEIRRMQAVCDLCLEGFDLLLASNAGDQAVLNVRRDIFANKLAKIRCENDGLKHKANVSDAYSVTPVHILEIFEEMKGFREERISGEGW